jgi:hypothetical protein
MVSMASVAGTPQGYSPVMAPQQETGRLNKLSSTPTSTPTIAHKTGKPCQGCITERHQPGSPIHAIHTD